MRIPSLLLLLSLLFLPLCAFAAVRPKALLGGWTPKDPKDPYVVEIANFAVTEYDKRNGAKLKLAKVITAESQVVSGTNYRLKLAANDGSATKNYEAVVWDRVWLHSRNLTSFKPV